MALAYCFVLEMRFRVHGSHRLGLQSDTTQESMQAQPTGEGELLPRALGPPFPCNARLTSLLSGVVSSFQQPRLPGPRFSSHHWMHCLDRYYFVEWTDQIGSSIGCSVPVPVLSSEYTPPATSIGVHEHNLARVPPGSGWGHGTKKCRVSAMDGKMRDCSIHPRDDYEKGNVSEH